MLRRVRNYIVGEPLEIAYRTSHIFNYQHPFPLLNLLTGYSQQSIPPTPINEDQYYHWRACITDQIRCQVQTLALLESYLKYHLTIPEYTAEGLIHPRFKVEAKASQILGAGKGLYVQNYGSTANHMSNQLQKHSQNPINQFSHGNKNEMPEEETETRNIAVKCGQVICLYPGLSYFYVRQGEIDRFGLNLRFPRGARDHILTLERSIWIDGNPRLSVVTNAQRNHMWARGHFINHPTQSFRPNCVPALFDFGPDFVAESSDLFKQVLSEKKINLENFVPCEFAWEFVASSSEFIPSAVMIAVRDIYDGEELFFDYEWEYNINYVFSSEESDLVTDWPWYQVVAQSTINEILGPFFSYRNFNQMTEKDSRLIKIKESKLIQKLGLNTGDSEDGSVEDEQLMIGEKSDVNKERNTEIIKMESDLNVKKKVMNEQKKRLIETYFDENIDLDATDVKRPNFEHMTDEKKKKKKKK